jgi:HK97 family phage portal protein
MPQLFSRLDAPGGPGLVSWLGQSFYGLALGNAVGWITETDGFGFPTGVEWLHWSQWSYDEMTRQWYAFGSPVPSSQLVHIPWIVPPGRRLGLSPIDCYAAIIAAGMSAQEYANIKRSGGLPPYVLKNSKQTVPPEVSAAMKSRATASFARGEPFVTGNDWDFTAVTIPPNHAQFIETLNLTAKQIAAAYGLDPREVGGETGDSLTYSTDESRSLNRAANMRPYIERIERGFARLLPARQYVRLNVDATIRADIKTRTDVVGAQLKDGRMNVDEARSLEDRGPVPGGSFYNVPAPKADPTNRGETP